MDIILGAEHFSQIFQVKQDLMKKPVFKRIIRNVKLLSGKCGVRLIESNLLKVAFTWL